MATTAPACALTVWLEPEPHDAAVGLARKRGVSLTALVQESLVAVIMAAEDQELYEAFERVGAHPDAHASHALHAQAEVAMANVYADGR